MYIYITYFEYEIIILCKLNNAIEQCREYAMYNVYYSSHLIWSLKNSLTRIKRK